MSWLSSAPVQGGPVEILPFLYLGSAYHASKCEFLANLHITALLNVSRRTSEACMTHLHYKWIPVEDSHTADISSHFQEAIDFIGRFSRSTSVILGSLRGALGFGFLGLSSRSREVSCVFSHQELELGRDAATKKAEGRF